SYFAALTGNFPLNEDNQCVAVATNMVCSFYDTYYNDNIINDGYERPVTCSWNYDAYGNAMYFTPLGSSPGAGFVYDPDYVKTGQDVLNPPPNSDLLLNVPAGPISPLPGIQLSLQAMDSTGTLALSQWCPLTNGQIISLLNDGFPVLVNYYIAGGVDHCVVAFDHDGNGNLLCHNGYPVGNPYGYPTFVVKSLSELSNCLAIVPPDDLPHVCSDNYRLTNGTPVCPCMMGVNYDPSHVHSSVRIDANSHYVTCPQTLQTVQKGHLHQIDPLLGDRYYHVAVCVCGDEVEADHDAVGYAPLDAVSHLAVCGDGCEVPEAHQPGVINPYGMALHIIECPCGAYTAAPHFQWAQFEYYYEEHWMCLCGYTDCVLPPETHDLIYQSLLESEGVEFL
ncbi:MAG: hypothetical protein IJS52_03365, partial [Bacilli bacterium]|nr:hypothetical protein [Bacilli bacterium]